MFRKIFIFICLFSSFAFANVEEYQKLADLLTGKIEQEQIYKESYSSHYQNFNNSFIEPILSFTSKHINSNESSLFYPFAGADISYPLLFFPNVEKILLIGLEFPGQTSMFSKPFNALKFKEQMEGYFRSGFFKTMNMSAQMHYDQGVIPMLIMQLGMFGGKITNVENISYPYSGLKINFIHNEKEKQLTYLRANLNDYNDKANFYKFVQENKLIGNCMLKASSYKLQQPEFKNLRKFMIDNCNYLLQDDTGVPVVILESLGGKIEFFGNYEKPYGDEFKPYYQRELNFIYKQGRSKDKLDFCYGYGCKKVETNILTWQKIQNNTN